MTSRLRFRMDRQQPRRWKQQLTAACTEGTTYEDSHTTGMGGRGGQLARSVQPGWSYGFERALTGRFGIDRGSLDPAHGQSAGCAASRGAHARRRHVGCRPAAVAARDGNHRLGRPAAAEKPALAATATAATSEAASGQAPCDDSAKPCACRNPACSNRWASRPTAGSSRAWSSIISAPRIAGTGLWPPPIAATTTC